MNQKLFKILDKVTPGASRSLGWEVVLMALAFPASILVNRNLGAEDRGLFSLVILVPTTVITLGTCQWDRLVKGAIASKKISSNEAWRRTIYYCLWLSLLFMPIGIIASLVYSQVSPAYRVISSLYSFTFPIIMLAGSLGAIYVAMGSIDGQYSMRIAYQGSYIVLVFILILLGWLSVPSLVFTYFAIWLISLLVGWSKKKNLLSGNKLTEKPSLFPLLWGFLPYSLESFSINADIWAFSIFSSVATLGHYVAITGLMQPVGLVSNALTSASTARLDWTQPSVVRRYLFKTIITMLCMLVLLSIGGILIGNHLLGWLLGRSFEGGDWMIPWIAGIMVCKAITNQFHFALQLSGQGKAYLVIQSLDSLIRSVMVLFLGSNLLELGILIGMILSLLIKGIICYIVFLKNNQNTKHLIEIEEQL